MVMKFIKQGARFALVLQEDVFGRPTEISEKTYTEAEASWYQDLYHRGFIDLSGAPMENIRLLFAGNDWKLLDDNELRKRLQAALNQVPSDFKELCERLKAESNG